VAAQDGWQPVDEFSDWRPDIHGATGTLRQSRPTLMWFNVAREGDKQPVSGLRFYPVPNYPAPVWRLSLSEWKAGAAPIAEPRARYGLAREISAFGPPALPFSTLRETLGAPRPVLARASSRLRSARWRGGVPRRGASKTSGRAVMASSMVPLPCRGRVIRRPISPGPARRLPSSAA